ncbi:MAG: glycosyltransferase [Planctomycetes bacterium]|nr:glycosyltransferase [Planctomycetota bacterium]
MALAAIVVAHRSAADLPGALDSLLAEMPAGAPVVVVDQASGDGTVELVRSKYAGVLLLAESTNSGFGAGVNRAVEACPAARYLLLNPDAWLEEGALAALAGALDGCGDRVGAVAPLVRRPEPDGRVDSLGIGLSRSLGPVSLHSGEPGRSSFAGGEVFGFHGAAALLDARMLRDMGGFDESFFCYQEEFDLSWRARRFGWRFFAEPAALVRHRVAGSSAGRQEWREYQLERNRLWAVTKNATGRDLARSWRELVRSEVNALRYGLAGGASWVLAARRDALAGLGRVLSERRRFERGKALSRDEALRWRGVGETV